MVLYGYRVKIHFLQSVGQIEVYNFFMNLNKLKTKTII